MHQCFPYVRIFPEFLKAEALFQMDWMERNKIPLLAINGILAWWSEALVYQFNFRRSTNQFLANLVESLLSIV